MLQQHAGRPHVGHVLRLPLRRHLAPRRHLARAARLHHALGGRRRDRLHTRRGWRQLRRVERTVGRVPLRQGRRLHRPLVGFLTGPLCLPLGPHLLDHAHLCAACAQLDRARTCLLPAPDRLLCRDDRGLRDCQGRQVHKRALGIRRRGRRPLVARCVQRWRGPHLRRPLALPEADHPPRSRGDIRRPRRGVQGGPLDRCAYASRRGEEGRARLDPAQTRY
mmetsp:Transcript_39062/g.96525  ORF Transcript_39062/g.96525 Transcript_39062/m.96525 type:complete len:221 (+) Transcript_39062:424-1086(+)